MKSYCVKEKKQTECVKPTGFQTAKNGRKMWFCHCASCGIKKTRFVIPWKERQWGHALARNTINAKQKLGLGAPKNGKRF